MVRQTTQTKNNEIQATVKIDITPVKVPIIVYHSIKPMSNYPTQDEKTFTVSPEMFEKQMQYLNENNYTTITFDDLFNYFQGKKLPENPVIINFDDGWKNQYTHAFPILKKTNNIATFYIFTNAIDHENYLSWEQIKEMSEANMEFGDHSHYHPYLWKIEDQTELDREIIKSKEIIEKHLGKTITTFAYPFGLYSSTTVEMVKKAGFTTARSFDKWGNYHSKDDLLTLRSIQITNSLNSLINALDYDK
ncbi:MAG: hypothetical protein A3F93_00690 [Candidatus Magasanikbacteria bacterium RIFCSPLOWO2_12_FULL_34_7]|nr:MAG: hypothetical protein A3F93_00690 [Candidatus Magasanikbacteria bacterium RIFCSPLOWO2_12_FULL_34_7]